MKHPAPLTPEELRRVLREIRRLSKVLEVEYEWGYRATYSGRVGESAHVQVSDPTDPTSSRALGETRSKRELQRISSRLQGNLESLRGAEFMLAKVLDNFDPHPRPEPLRYPRSESQQDLSEHAEAQERRQERGDAYGEG